MDCGSAKDLSPCNRARQGLGIDEGEKGGLPAHGTASAATALGARDAMWSMIIAGVDPNPAKAAQQEARPTDYWAAAHPFDREGQLPYQPQHPPPQAEGIRRHPRDFGGGG